MKQLFTITLLAISILCFGQDYSFKPNWKVGEAKKIVISQVEREYEDDELIQDSTTYNEASIKVLEDNEGSYTFELLMENQALVATMAIYETIGEDLDDYKNLKLTYSINKETGKADLLNWEDARDFMNESFDQITGVLEEKAPGVASFSGLLFMPMKEAFKSKENMEGYMESSVGYFLTPFQNDYKIGETVEKIESGENPFNPRQEVSTTTKQTLRSINEKTKIATIDKEVILDLSEFIEMMKGMMLEMAKSFGVSDSAAINKTNEIDDFEMDITNREVIEFNYETTWVTKVVSTATVKGFDPKKKQKTKTEVITTTLVK